jgi:chromosome segregation ATPase
VLDTRSKNLPPHAKSYTQPMTELETRLLTLVQRMEQSYQERDRQFASTLADLTMRLNASAAQLTTLSAHVTDLSMRIERLRGTLTRR